MDLKVRTTLLVSVIDWGRKRVYRVCSKYKERFSGDLSSGRFIEGDRLTEGRLTEVRLRHTL